MFDFDDGVYLALLNPRQRDYLDEVPIVCRRNENIDSTWLVMLALIGAPLGVQSCCRSRAVHIQTLTHSPCVPCPLSHTLVLACCSDGPASDPLRPAMASGSFRPDG